MSSLKVLFLFISIFSFSNASAGYDPIGSGGEADKAIVSSQKNNSAGGSGPSSSEVSSGVNALAAITGDSRVTSVANLYMGYELYKKGNAEGSWNGTAAFYYGLAALEVAQAGMNLKTSKSSNNAGNYLSNDGFGGSGNGSGGETNGLGLNGNDENSDVDEQFEGLSNDPNIKAIYGSIPSGSKLLKDLKKKGVSVNPETGDVTLANGKTLSKSDLAKKAKEFTKSAQFKKLAKDLARKRRVYLNRVARFRGASGGGYKSVTMRRGSTKSKRPGINYKFGNEGSRGIASVPGKVKMVNGDPLGAASDNVFHIVERAYQGLVTNKVLQEKVPKLGK